MNSRYPAGLDEAHFAELLWTFDIDVISAKLVGASQNFVYSADRHGVPCIARISALRYRKREEIEAELEWIAFLNGNGVPVCPAFTSKHGHRCEQLLICGKEYLLAVFERANGRHPVRTDLSTAFCFKIGRLIGKMHASAVTAAAQGFRFQRPDWKISRLLTNDMETTRAPLTEAFRLGVRSLVSDIGRLPATATNYGLIHSDVNVGNCHIDGEELRIFDFDNCEYGYFLQDLVTLLYDTLYSKIVKHVPVTELTSAVGTLWDATLEGYFQSGPSLTFSAEELCRFFLLREAIIYVHYHRILPSASWSDPFLAEMRRHVEMRSHPLDFEQLAN